MDKMFSNAQRAEVLTQALPYIKEYNGSHDIVKVKIIAPYKDGAIAEIQGE